MPSPRVEVVCGFLPSVPASSSREAGISSATSSYWDSSRRPSSKPVKNHSSFQEVSILPKRHRTADGYTSDHTEGAQEGVICWVTLHKLFHLRHPSFATDIKADGQHEGVHVYNHSTWKVEIGGLSQSLV